MLTENINIRLEPKLKQALKAVAEQENRKVSNLAAMILREWVEKRKGNGPKNA